jgi:hypothetical protein
VDRFERAFTEGHGSTIVHARVSCKLAR